MGFQLCCANKYLSAKNSASDNTFTAWNAKKIIFRVRCFLHVPVATPFQISEKHVIFFGSSRAFEKVLGFHRSFTDMFIYERHYLQGTEMISRPEPMSPSVSHLTMKVLSHEPYHASNYTICIFFRKLLMSQRKWHVFRRSEMVWPPEREENNGLEK